MKIFSKAGPNWSGFFLVFFLLFGLVLTSCQTESEPDKPLFKKASRTDGPTRSYLGLTKEKAVAKARRMGLRSRIVRDDFERFRITKDLRTDRINFEIDKGFVTAAKIF